MSNFAPPIKGEGYLILRQDMATSHSNFGFIELFDSYYP